MYTNHTASILAFLATCCPLLDVFLAWYPEITQICATLKVASVSKPGKSIPIALADHSPLLGSGAASVSSSEGPTNSIGAARMSTTSSSARHAQQSTYQRQLSTQWQ